MHDTDAAFQCEKAAVIGEVYKNTLYFTYITKFDVTNVQRVGQLQ